MHPKMSPGDASNRYMHTFTCTFRPIRDTYDFSENKIFLCAFFFFFLSHGKKQMSLCFFNVHVFYTVSVSRPEKINTHFA